jgi:hypothetical protein
MADVGRYRGFICSGDDGPRRAQRMAQATEITGCGREDSRVTGIRQSRSGRSPWSCRIPGAIRRPAKRAEYTVGRVLVDTYETFTEDGVRKRGLACDWNTAKSEWTQSTELSDSRCNTQARQAGRVHRRSSPRRYVRNVYREPGAEERTRTSTSFTSLDP